MIGIEYQFLKISCFFWLKLFKYKTEAIANIT